MKFISPVVFSILVSGSAFAGAVCNNPISFSSHMSNNSGKPVQYVIEMRYNMAPPGHSNPDVRQKVLTPSEGSGVTLNCSDLSINNQDYKLLSFSQTMTLNGKTCSVSATSFPKGEVVNKVTTMEPDGSCQAS